MEKKKEIARQKDYMAAKFGIHSLRELKQETRKLTLNIGCFVTPPVSTPATAKLTAK